MRRPAGFFPGAPYHFRVASVRSVNVGTKRPHPSKRVGFTGIDKQPVDSAEFRAPGPKLGGLGSGLVNDFIGDHGHHGGNAQAVYAVAREELDHWERTLARGLADGCFGENLTTIGLDVDGALVGERWLVGDEVDGVILTVTCPRIPCNTFKGAMQEKGWVKTFAEHGRSGAYLSVTRPGTVRRGDPITILERPDHDVSIEVLFRALTLEPALATRALTARAYLEPEGIDKLERRETYSLG